MVFGAHLIKKDLDQKKRHPTIHAHQTPLEIDYENESVNSIIEKIEFAIEQHPSFLKVLKQEEIEEQERLNQTRRYDF